MQGPVLLPNIAPVTSAGAQFASKALALEAVARQWDHLSLVRRVLARMGVWVAYKATAASLPAQGQAQGQWQLPETSAAERLDLVAQASLNRDYAAHIARMSTVERRPDVDDDESEPGETELFPHLKEQRQSLGV
jgi:hypothetical protein